MPTISVAVPAALVADLDEHVGPDATCVTRSDAIRASIRPTPSHLAEFDPHPGRLDHGP